FAVLDSVEAAVVIGEVVLYVSPEVSFCFVVFSFHAEHVAKSEVETNDVGSFQQGLTVVRFGYGGVVGVLCGQAVGLDVTGGIGSDLLQPIEELRCPLSINLVEPEEPFVGLAQGSNMGRQRRRFAQG